MIFWIILTTGCRRTTKPPEIGIIPPGGAKIDIHLSYPTSFLNIRQNIMVLRRKTPFLLILALSIIAAPIPGWTNPEMPIWLLWYRLHSRPS